MTSRAHTASLLLPPFVLMGVIFFLSAQPHLSSGLGTWDLIGRKLVHMGEYALLCLLWWRALRTRLSHRAALAAAFALAVGYSATDELHQTFVSGRHGSPIDVLIDTVGAGLMVWRLDVLVRRRRATA